MPYPAALALPGTDAASRAPAEGAPRLGVMSPHMAFAVQVTQLADGRWPVAACAADPEAAPRACADCTHAVVDLTLVDSTDALAALLAACPAYVLAVAPNDMADEILEAVRGTPGVDACVREADLPATLDALLRPPAATGDAVPGAPQAPLAIGGWRSIAVWGLEGGVGKTRLARGLGLECAARGYKALAVGLGAPDMLPLGAGLHPEPNLAGWAQDPRPEALQAQVQADGDLDLLAGFLSPPALGQFAVQALDGETSLSALAMQTARLGYAAVVFDVSSQELAAPALKASNALVLVCSATAQGAVAAVEAYRLARREIGLTAAQCHLALNRRRAGHLTAAQFVGAVRSALKDAPHPAVVLDEDPGQDALHAPAPGAAWGGDAWRQGLRRLGDQLFGADPKAAPPVSEMRFGPLVFKKGG